MKNKKTCAACRYHRQAGSLDFDIPGTGNWCSNSQSPRYRTRTADDDTCEKFEDKGRAPVMLRFFNKELSKRSKRKKK